MEKVCLQVTGLQVADLFLGLELRIAALQKDSRCPVAFTPNSRKAQRCAIRRNRALFKRLDHILTMHD